MARFRPRHVVGELIQVLNRELRRVLVRTVRGIRFKKDDVRERVKSGERLIPEHRNRLVKTVITKPKFVYECWRKRMIFRERSNIGVNRLNTEEHGRKTCGVNGSRPLQNESTTQRVF